MTNSNVTTIDIDPNNPEPLPEPKTPQEHHLEVMRVLKREGFEYTLEGALEDQYVCAQEHYSPHPGDCVWCGCPAYIPRMVQECAVKMVESDRRTFAKVFILDYLLSVTVVVDEDEIVHDAADHILAQLGTPLLPNGKPDIEAQKAAKAALPAG